MAGDAEELVRAMGELRDKSRVLYEEHQNIVREYERLKEELQQLIKDKNHNRAA
jgi:vacuolar-type H+-ATPase subunit D/Vma8